MGELKERLEHSLALKVMRLTKPAFAVSSLGVPALSDSSKDEMLITALRDDLSGCDGPGLGRLLLLPQSFGNIYLGETFSSYVCVHNDSTDACRNVSVKADLQTASQRLSLVAGQERAELLAGETIDNVVQHEVKELGTHILVCDVAYSSPSADRLNFRKFFKFQVMKPLDVKTKFYNAETEDVFLEAQVQNITSGTITLERVVLEPSSAFTVKAMNVRGGEEESSRAVFSIGECLQSQDSWQYLFCLSPQSGHKSLKPVTNIGKLDIVWRALYCDKGRLQTSQLQRLLPTAGDIKIYFVAAPAFVLINKPFPLTIRIVNNCERTVELELELESSQHNSRLTWTGVTGRGLGLLEPGGSVKCDLECVLHDTGLQSITGIKIEDSLLRRVYRFNDQVQVYAVQDADLYAVLADQIV